MLARFGFAFTIVLATVLAGCGGKEEVKKNEGTLTNKMPTGGTPGGPAGGATGAGKSEAPPPIPAIQE
jgi:hypothetical protein